MLLEKSSRWADLPPRLSLNSLLELSLLPWSGLERELDALQSSWKDNALLSGKPRCQAVAAPSALPGIW